jgi:hypothetical protein
MLKIAKYAIIANLLIALIFIYSNITLWDSINSNNPNIVTSHWSPLFVTSMHHYLKPDGTYVSVQGIFESLNSPFLIFWALLIVNLLFVLRLGMQKESR